MSQGTELRNRADLLSSTRSDRSPSLKILVEEGFTSVAFSRCICPVDSMASPGIIQDGLRRILARKPARVQLIAVSKFHPVESILAAYEAGQRVFGENYVAELVEKAQHPKLQSLPDLQWHFIGHLQSNKAKLLIKSVPNLACVQTVDTTKIADRLNAAAKEFRTFPLPVYIQINTSSEASKSGVSPGGEVALAQHIVSSCPELKIAGVMTIGNPDFTSTPENFATLIECRSRLMSSLALPPSSDGVPSLDLSMGMSADWEAAVETGSTCVRVGSAIFGPRPTKPDAVVQKSPGGSDCGKTESERDE